MEFLTDLDALWGGGGKKRGIQDLSVSNIDGVSEIAYIRSNIESNHMMLKRFLRAVICYYESL